MPPAQRQPRSSPTKCPPRAAQRAERSTPRGDLAPGLRTVPYRRRTISGYRVVDGRVEVLRLVHGGQEWDGLEDGEV